MNGCGRCTCFFQCVMLRTVCTGAKDSTQSQSLCGIEHGEMWRGPGLDNDGGERAYINPSSPRRACSTPSHPRNGSRVTDGEWCELNSSQAHQGDDFSWPCQAFRGQSSRRRSGATGKHIAEDVSEIGGAWHQADQM